MTKIISYMNLPYDTAALNFYSIIFRTPKHAITDASTFPRVADWLTYV